jgi:hypothetical protein
MGLVHIFDFEVTKKHYFIKRTKNPRLTSAIMGIITLFLSFLILILLNFTPGINLETLFVFLGFGIWVIFLAISFERYEKKNK